MPVAFVLSCLGSATRSWSVLVLDLTGGFLGRDLLGEAGVSPF